jgi:integrase/recombinase XerC
MCYHGSPMKRLPNTLSIEQINQLLAFKGVDFLSIRDSAMLELMYSSGLTVSELVNLSLDDLVAGGVNVQGSMSRFAPFGIQAATAIQKWLVERSYAVAEGVSEVFIGRNGSQLTVRAVQKRLDFWAEVQGIQELHPSMLRHSAAVHMLESSNDLRLVQTFLGHSNVNTTQIYEHLNFKRLNGAYRAAHPRSRLQVGL